MGNQKVRVELPDELIFNILSYMPVDCLIKCTTVCKSWYSFIKSPNFISHHLAISRNRDPPLVLANTLCTHVLGNEQYSLHFADKAFSKYTSLPGPSIPYDYFLIIGSCDGIVCLYFIFGEKIIFWNPSIRKSLLLPSPLFYFRDSEALVGFGFDSSTDDYKVFGMLNGSHFKPELYSFNADSWKELPEIDPVYNIKRPIRGAFVNGALHWAVEHPNDDVGFRSSVLVFDLKDEIFGEIMLPYCLLNVSANRLSVMVYGKSSIAVVSILDQYGNSCDIWIMKEYGEESSWERLWKRTGGLPTVLGCINNDLQALVDHGNRFFCSHTESLILLDK